MIHAAMPTIVEAIYDSIADTSRWHDTLDRIRERACGHLAALAVVDTARSMSRFSVTCGDPVLLGPLVSEYSAGVPFYSSLPKMEIDVPFTVDSLYEMQGPDARQTWLDSRITREWVVPNNLDDFFWVALMRQPNRVGTLIIITHKDRPQISSDDLHDVAMLAPHVRRAVTISDMFETERRTADIFRHVVESLAHAVVVVAADMSILFANSAAEALLREGTAMSSARGHLLFAYAHANAAVGRAVALGTRDEFALGPAGINVPLARTAVPAVAHVMPLARRDVSARVTQRAAAAIFVAAAGTGPLPAVEAFGALFGLTAAEKRVAGHVAAGLTRGEIAGASGVSDGTVKSQLAAIYDKTGTSDQRELQLLIRELSPPVASA